MKRAKHECFYPGCHELTIERYCEKHRASNNKDRRESAFKRGYNSKWNRARRVFLIEHPTCECEECRKSGNPLPANVVDHIIPHRGDQKLFWDRKNWQAMNKRCHDKKTAQENGGFGNKIIF